MYLPNFSVFILKSIPIVVINDCVKLESEYRKSKQDFPTPESPLKEFILELFRSYKCMYFGFCYIKIDRI